jgi:hypothetical protein
MSAAPSKAESLDAVYQNLQELLLRYAPPLKTSSGAVPGKKDFHLTVPKAVVVPGAYGGKPVEIALADLILQKGYVGFYFMPIYVEPALKKHLSPALTKLLKGKTCFHVTHLEDDMVKHFKAALDEGVKCYKSRGWL